MREKDEIVRDFIKEKKDTMDLIFSKIKDVLEILDEIEESEECDKAKLILCQCLILTDLTLMDKEEVKYLNNI